MLASYQEKLTRTNGRMRDLVASPTEAAVVDHATPILFVKSGGEPGS